MGVPNTYSASINEINLPVNTNNTIAAKDLAQRLRDAANIDINQCQVLYRQQGDEAYTFAGIYAAGESSFAIPFEPELTRLLELKCRPLSKEASAFQASMLKKGHQREEKRIDFVLHALQEYRKLKQNKERRYTPTEVAQLIGVPKKTLDNYKAEVKYARDHGFDFQYYAHSGFGVLRRFNKEKKAEASHCASSSPDHLAHDEVDISYP